MSAGIDVAEDTNQSIQAVGENLDGMVGGQRCDVEDRREVVEQSRCSYPVNDGSSSGSGSGNRSGNGSGGRQRSSWVKEVQHLQLQESGYQNKYIWVQQRFCVECSPKAIATATCHIP